MLPCGVQYHGRCLRAGAPFTTRLASARGLVCPIDAPGFFPNFVCEACQVRQVLGRELVRSDKDVTLLMLERMRQLDTMHKLAQGTLLKYKGQYHRLRRFEKSFGVECLIPTPLVAPSSSPAIPLTWAQLHYSIQPGKTEGFSNTYGTARQMRSAASFYYQWDLQAAYPYQAIRDSANRDFLVNHASPTDEMLYSLQQGGMARRMGTTGRPSWALQLVHLKFLMAQFDTLWAVATTDAARHEVATATCATLVLWLAWLRGGETFALRWEDVKLVPPEQGAACGLPPGLGFIEFRLLPEPKSSPHQTADVVIAWETATGLQPGLWFSRLARFQPENGYGLFSTSKRRSWDSKYFRSTYLWPFLDLQRQAGEPTLRAFTDVEGQRIQDKMYSCHSFRRGAATFTRKKQPHTSRGATKDEIYAHARWRRRFGTEDIDQHYTDLPLLDRLAITFLCM